MGITFWRKKKPATSPVIGNKVLVLIDWDNIFFCLWEVFNKEMRIDYRLKKLKEWIENNIGEILDGKGFVFAPEHLSVLHQQICVQNDLKLMTCPKKQKRSTEKKMEEEDTVDETLIWFGKMMMRHPDIGFICLVSGDNDYVPLFERAASCGIKRVLIPPTINSLSKSKTLIKLVDRHPQTGELMKLIMDTL